MRRFITILIIVIVIAAIVIGVGWLFSRKSAQKNGTTPLTFKEFVTGDTTPGTSTGNPDDELSGSFTGENPGSTPIPGGTNTGTPNTPGVPDSTNPDNPNTTRTSIFTNNNLSPATNFDPLSPGLNTSPTTPGSKTTGGVQVDDGGDVIAVPTVNPSGTTGTSVPVASDPLASCSDADLNITFTPAELARLQTLQTRFYAVAQTLKNDASVSTEQANHDTFKAKVAKIMELYNYCQNKAPQIAGTQYQTRVPTPFWRDPSKDTIAGFVSQPRSGIIATPSANGYFGSGSLRVRRDTSVENGKAVLERVLRLSLW